jgi:glutathione S-transferase
LHIGATEAERSQAWRELEVALARLEGEARRVAPGPYWFGATPSLVDFTLYPVFEHWAALAQHGMPALPSSLTWLPRWQETLSQWASVRACASTPEFYAQRYARSPALRPRAQSGT